MKFDLLKILWKLILNFVFTANANTHSNIDTLPRSETASYSSINSPTPSSVATSGAGVGNGGGGGGSGSSNFDIDFNESILQVHKRSPLYIIGDRAQHRVSLKLLKLHEPYELFRKISYSDKMKACAD